jgi:AAA domain-containing protein
VTWSDYSRKAKDDAQIDWDAEVAKWDATIGGRLAEVADAALGRWQPDAPAPGAAAYEEVVRAALARVQREHSTWTKPDLMKVLGWSMGPQFAHMDPDTRQRLLLELAERALSPHFGVKCLEAPEWSPVPQSLRREMDGRSVYTAPGTERYATHGQLSMEEALLQRAQRHGAPYLAREEVAARLGTDADTLDAVLRGPASDAAQTTRAGLRLDQASMIYEALTSDLRVSVGVGPAGSGKTYTLGAAVGAWEASGGGQVIGITSSQAARNVLAQAGIGDAWNSTRFLARMREPGQHLAGRTLVIIDEGSTISRTYLAEIVALAERDNAKVLLTGDHQQLAAVQAGAGMSLLAHHLGHTQLAVPVRFTAQWEQEASLRLRAGDKTALEVYDEHGRITGGAQEHVFEDARRAYVAARLAGEDVLLMAYAREDCQERVPEIADPARQEFVRRLAEAMDERKDRIGQHAAEVQPEWAVRGLGPVPGDPAERLDWQQRASAIGAYRELYGVEDQADVLGPEPVGSSPEQRAAWHAGFAALTRTDTIDVRVLPEASLWHMRDTYKAETEWAPLHVGRQLRGIRLAAENARQLTPPLPRRSPGRRRHGHRWPARPDGRLCRGTSGCVPASRGQPGRGDGRPPGLGADHRRCPPAGRCRRLRATPPPPGQADRAASLRRATRARRRPDQHGAARGQAGANAQVGDPARRAATRLPGKA